MLDGLFSSHPIFNLSISRTTMTTTTRCRTRRRGRRGCRQLRRLFASGSWTEVATSTFLRTTIWRRKPKSTRGRRRRQRRRRLTTFCQNCLSSSNFSCRSVVAPSSVWLFSSLPGVSVRNIVFFVKQKKLECLLLGKIAQSNIHSKGECLPKTIARRCTWLPRNCSSGSNILAYFM